MSQSDERKFLRANVAVEGEIVWESTMQYDAVPIVSEVVMRARALLHLSQYG